MASKLTFGDFRETAWYAPLAVLAFHQFEGAMGWRGIWFMDGLLHFSGGIAIAWFLWSTIPLLGKLWGPINQNWRMPVSLAFAWSVALLWELAEWASDVFLGTQVQHTVSETMGDLFRGALGALLAVICLQVWTNSRAKFNRL